VTAIPSFDVPAIAQEYAAALLERRQFPSMATDILRRAHREGMSLETICAEVIPAALHEVGRRWEAGEASVADEHLATETAQDALREFAPLLDRRPPRGETVVVAAVDGELHGVAARLLGDLLQADGWDVLYVGTATPADALARVVLERQPRAVALSATLEEHLPALEATIDRLRAPDMPAVFLIAGGQGCGTESVRSRLRADIVATDAAEGVQALGRLAARVASAP
jgi:methanogenic corrinoid protein MtbC1